MAGPTASERAHSRSDDGDRRSLSNRTERPIVFFTCLLPVQLTVADIGAATLLLAGFSALSQRGHQARPRVFNNQPDRLHVFGVGCRRLVSGDLPSDDARLLQGTAFSRRGHSYSGHARRTRHVQNGWLASAFAGDVLDVSDRRSVAVSVAAGNRGLFQQRLDSMERVVVIIRQHLAVGCGFGRGTADFGLHVSHGVPHVFR